MVLERIQPLALVRPPKAYIERNRVRAGMVSEAADYPWSSYRPRMGLDANAWFHPDPGYLGLGDSEPVRRSTAGNRDQRVTGTDLYICPLLRSSVGRGGRP